MAFMDVMDLAARKTLWPVSTQPPRERAGIGNFAAAIAAGKPRLVLILLLL
jgi:hypothetical protein